MQIIIQAVVLRYIAAEPVTLALYTERYGRITVYDVSRRRQWQEPRVGDLCYAAIGQRGNKWFLYNLESAITHAARSDSNTFFWQHHILDMYYYYVPLQQPSAHLFVLLTHILKVSVADAIIFKLLIVHFFSLLGYHVPLELSWYRVVLAKLESQFHNCDDGAAVILDASAANDTADDVLNTWLVTMVTQHDHFQYLKTQQFLSQLYSIPGL